MTKSKTDFHWNERAINETDKAAVNIADISQRELETEFILKHISHDDRVLEVGCGNGFLTNILRENVEYVDAFDYAENMVVQAVQIHAEKNNRFFNDNVLHPVKWNGLYDSIICVRVLINLRNFDEQKVAIDNMRKALKPGGKLILVEGYTDGFDELNSLRVKTGIEPLSPASINYYSGFGEMRTFLEKNFDITAEFHTGSFDYLTRVVYPTLVGSSNATGHSEFHAKIKSLAKNFNPDQFKAFSRLHGFVLVS